MVTVGCHAGAVADVVADVIGDYRGVAWIVLGDPGLDFADQVRADIRRLRVDAAAQSGEDRYEGSAEGKADQRVRALEDVISGRNAQEAQADHHEARHRATSKSDLKRLVQAATRRLGGAHVGPHGDVHTDVARPGREDGPDDVQRRGRPVDREADDDGDQHPDDRDHGVLAIQVGGGAFLDGGRNFAHAIVAGGLAQDHDDQDHREQHGGQAPGHPEQN